ncbi:MAG: ABC transporter permease [Alphaproteobacteria bacterium]|nr:ABC transporter permease [Alphaproteobacteria bacterium]
MTGFLLNRAAQSIVSFWGAISIVFVIMHLSGDPTLLLVPEGATRADIEQLRHLLGFDRPLIVQYADYLFQLLRFDFGASLIQRVPVMDIILSRLPYTLWLGGCALALALLIGIPVGVLTGLFRGRLVDRICMPIVLIGQSMPTFWSGILLILLFAVELRWLPSSGAESSVSVIMPAVALGALSMATYARIARTGVIEELSKEYVRAVRAKGVSGIQVVLSHVLRNASIPIITVSALEIANLLAGAVIVETVFAWPGLGQLAVQSIASRDFLVVQGLVVLGAFTHIGLNFVADLLYGVVDPRISLSRRDT